MIAQFHIDEIKRTLDSAVIRYTDNIDVVAIAELLYSAYLVQYIVNSDLPKRAQYFSGEDLE